MPDRSRTVVSNPLVSIGIPTRNRAASLRHTLARILTQEYAPLEIVVSDNCSDDETEQVCREFAQADRRVRYVRQPRNIGLYANHNFCLDSARGEFLCLFHDHDRHHPGVIDAYVQFMRAHSSVGIVCSDWNLIDDNDAQLGIRRSAGPVVTPGLDYIGQTIRSGRSSVGTPGLMVRRDALGAVRFAADAPIHFGDFPVWFEVAERWDIGHIGEQLWSWRQNAISHSARPIHDMVSDFEQNVGGYCDAHLARWPAHAALVDRWRASIDRFLFWALAYEVALHFRPENAHERQRHERTLFEVMDYRLTADELQNVLARMKRYQRGVVTCAVRAGVKALVDSGLTWPLARMIRHHSTLRTLLGLK